MAAPDELFCWEGDWGLPSVSTDCLVVLPGLRCPVACSRINGDGLIDYFLISWSEYTCGLYAYRWYEHTGTSGYM
ncbi:Metaxin-1 [Liparis tanakae]|uniref:Metaxin-1 n=1 Tax=Liparis tanakae TaxID=230148 RepID=A0A4Z2ED67_9TELE|nr:Metaxin-1 [Liparis tanakae]